MSGNNEKDYDCFFVDSLASVSSKLTGSQCSGWMLTCASDIFWYLVKRSPFQALWSYGAALMFVSYSPQLVNSWGCKTMDMRPVHHVVCPFTPQLSLVLINRPRTDGMLSWRWYTAATGEIWTRDIVIASPALYHTTTSLLKSLDVFFGQV